LAVHYESAIFETVANNPNDLQTKESFDELVSDIFLIEKAKSEGAPKPTLTASVKQARKTRKVDLRQSKLDSTGFFLFLHIFISLRYYCCWIYYLFYV
jgi:hypothetical protein